uniref:Uncharacterized protein n=1 Tax=Tetranychus urticae TaxID=32264 RepID=T1KGV3_TETUR
MLTVYHPCCYRMHRIFRTEITSREILNVLVLFQISLGVLYVAITLLGFVALKRAKEQPDISIPDQHILEFNLIVGCVMIINGYATQISIRRGLIAIQEDRWTYIASLPRMFSMQQDHLIHLESLDYLYHQDE